MRIGKGSCNGTFGELLQGELNNRSFLVTLPIKALASKATFLPSLNNPRVIGSNKHSKAITACEKLLKMFQIKSGGWLLIDSNIPIGKGLASSSSDIVATLRAVAQSFNLPLTAEMTSAIASEIEPTDGVMYDEVVSYDHLQGSLIESLGSMPQFGLIGVDVGGRIDTIQFNQNKKNYDMNDRLMFLEAYELVKIGIKNKDLSKIFKATTMSAQINEKILPKPYFREFETVAKQFNAGVIVAHSGTVIGILFDPNQANMNEFYYEITLQLSLLKKDNPILKPYSYLGWPNLQK